MQWHTDNVEALVGFILTTSEYFNTTQNLNVCVYVSVWTLTLTFTRELVEKIDSTLSPWIYGQQPVSLA